ncbi:MAG: hypothetical protein NT159_20675 [Proteobacteria bacterium]|nr:hypothetical protein [Pseudomonadota bacterium]
MFNRTPIGGRLGLILGGGLSSALLLVTSAHGQSTDTAAPRVERIEVTGSSIKRIDGETALPVQVMTREDIQRTGASNAEQLLKMVSATASSGERWSS